MHGLTARILLRTCDADHIGHTIIVLSLSVYNHFHFRLLTGMFGHC